MRKPVPDDFGITAEEYTKFMEGHNPFISSAAIVTMAEEAEEK